MFGGIPQGPLKQPPNGTRAQDVASDPGPGVELVDGREALDLGDVHKGREPPRESGRGHGRESGAPLAGSISPTCPNSGGPESRLGLILAGERPAGSSTWRGLAPSAQFVMPFNTTRCAP